ncbi:hypothetical protein [Mesorhizobium sp. LNJC391B00]|uniref:hypothetical protein n=1 Tax=Mesorhizobium sp. LNJC391B00 TaxID=1287273 RepID=UPI0003F65C35|nr:hypothetical protein [Mesorhizobium sp. LNJC391B00]
MAKNGSATEDASANHVSPVALKPSASAGAPSDTWADMLAAQTLLTLWNGDSSSEDRAKRLNAILDAFESIAPRDELEGMMVSQMIAAHNAVMECFRRAMLPNQTLIG